MKSIRIMALLMGVLLLGACEDTERIRPHEDQPNADMYCRYKIDKITGQSPRKVGDEICIYCPPPASKKCKAKREVSPDGEQTWVLKRISNTCVSCQAGVSNRYELIN